MTDFDFINLEQKQGNYYLIPIITTHAAWSRSEDHHYLTLIHTSTQACALFNVGEYQKLIPKLTVNMDLAYFDFD